MNQQKRGEGLKGFSDYSDYLSYAQVCLSWMNDQQHKQFYEMLLSQQDKIDPVTAMREMAAELHKKTGSTNRKAFGWGKGHVNQ